MPAKSDKQYRYMQLVASGKIKKKGLSKAQAKEFLKHGKPSKKKDPKKEALKKLSGY
tara:strand:- start:2110 stop:2280 length:171 start_codon:yes stop_codon:yes gene_type:complete